MGSDVSAERPQGQRGAFRRASRGGEYLVRTNVGKPTVLQTALDNALNGANKPGDARLGTYSAQQRQLGNLWIWLAHGLTFGGGGSAGDHERLLVAGVNGPLTARTLVGSGLRMRACSYLR
jgi:hypothetical protein